MNTNAMHPSVGLKKFNFFGPAVSCSAAAPVVDVRALLTAVTIWSTSAGTAPTPNMQHTLVTLWGLVSLVTVMLIPAVHLAAVSGSLEGDKAVDLQISPVREVRSQAPEQPVGDPEKESGTASLTSLKDDFDVNEYDDDGEEDQFSARGRESFDSGVDEKVSGARANFTKTCECGRKVNRIVGGHETHISEYPWQVALFNRGKRWCGGSLITNSHILSAAHCFFDDDVKAEDVVVHLREHDLTTPLETETVTRTVSQIYNHENYDQVTVDNDIAILKLSSPVKISSTLVPVCLPSSRRKKYSGKEAIVTGWGALSSGSVFNDDDYPDALQEVTVPVLSQKDCKKNTLYDPSQITDQMLCAGKAGHSACSGDSGGPLVFRNKKGRHDQIGIVSFGSQVCAAEGTPTVFTRVNKFLGWIENRTKDGVYCMGSRFPKSSSKRH